MEPQQFDKAEHLSVAVEPKFLMPFRPRRADSPRPNGPPLVQTVDFIEAAGTALTPDQQEKLHRHAFRAIAEAINAGCPGQRAVSVFDLDGRAASDYWETHWLVKKSNSAEPSPDHPHRADWLWVPVEINSPKFSWKGDALWTTVETVLRALRARYHLETNFSCEVHVHLGRLDGRRLLLPSLRRLAMLSWLAEPVLRRVKDPRSPNFAHVYTWSSPLRERSRLAAQVREKKAGGGPTTPVRRLDDGLGAPSGTRHDEASAARNVAHTADTLSALRHILASESHVALGRLMTGEGRPYRRLGFNFYSLLRETLGEAERTGLETVECRFLEGVLDEHVVLGWIRIFGNLVELALDSGTEDCFIETVFNAIEMEAAGCALEGEAFVSLMNGLGVDPQAYRPVQTMMEQIDSSSTNTQTELSGFLTAPRAHI